MAEGGLINNISQQFVSLVSLPHHPHAHISHFHLPFARAISRACHHPHGPPSGGNAGGDPIWESIGSYFDIFSDKIRLEEYNNHFFFLDDFKNLRWTALALMRHSCKVRLLVKRESTLLDNRLTLPTTSSFISPDQIKGDGVHLTRGTWSRSTPCSCFVCEHMWNFEVILYPVNFHWVTHK